MLWSHAIRFEGRYNAILSLRPIGPLKWCSVAGIFHKKTFPKPAIDLKPEWAPQTRDLEGRTLGKAQLYSEREGYLPKRKSDLNNEHENWVNRMDFYEDEVHGLTIKDA